jgi:hypothetical protein
VQHSNTCGMHHFPLTLGACLLNGCGMGSMDRQEALTLVQRWQQTVGSGDTPWDDSRLGALEGLAPEYQPLSQLSPWLERLKPLQQKDMNRMRGLVQLGTAYATLGHPVSEVLMVRQHDCRHAHAHACIFCAHSQLCVHL